MSTNFYAYPKDPDIDDVCRHIGKRNAGSSFIWRGHDDARILSPSDWIELLDSGGYHILDEYSRTYSPNEFVRVALAQFRDDDLICREFC